MLDKESGAVSKTDEYGRNPLHIAVDIIKLLLGADKAIGNFRTKHLRQLPLHIALNRGCHDTIENVVKELIDVDEEGSNIRTKTAIGRLPLHIAIEKKLPIGVIELLLGADAMAVYVMFNGKLPIHIACLK